MSNNYSIGLSEKYLASPNNQISIVGNFLVDNGDGNVMDPISNQLVNSSSVLAHDTVTTVSDGCEVKVVVVLFPESLDLALIDPGSPWSRDLPVKLLDPLASAQGWYNTVNITRVVENTHLWVVFHNPIDPNGATVGVLPHCHQEEASLIPFNFTIFVHGVVNVKNVFDFLPVEVIS